MKRIIYSTFFVLTMLLAFGATDADAQRRNRNQQPTFGRLSVKTAPQSYEVYLNGRFWQNSGVSSAVESDLPPGTYTVEIRFPKKTWTKEVVINAGQRNCICLNYTERVITLPCPYPVSVSAPDIVKDGDLVTFATLVDYAGPGQLNYSWSVTPETARITSGQGTPSITVDTTGLGGQRITARVIVDDGSGDPKCRNENQAGVGVQSIEPEIPRSFCFDCFSFVAFDDVKARLDNYAIELQNRQDVQGYIIVYGRRGTRRQVVDRLGARAYDYLTKNRGIDPRRLVLVNGGFRDRAGYDLYIVPQGAAPPVPSATIPQPGPR